MRYYVTVDGRTLEVDLSGDEPRVDGEPVAVELSATMPAGDRHMVAGGRTRAVVVRRRGRREWEVHLDGERFALEVVDERTRTIQAMAGEGAAARGPVPVRAPMPGLVVRVAVEPGDRVAAGQRIAIIEAMKMENELKAVADGVVANVAVAAGQPVAKGDLLVEFAAEDTDG